MAGITYSHGRRTRLVRVGQRTIPLGGGMEQGAITMARGRVPHRTVSADRADAPHIAPPGGAHASVRSTPGHTRHDLHEQGSLPHMRRPRHAPIAARSNVNERCKRTTSTRIPWSFGE